MKKTTFWMTAALVAALACPAFARVEDYGPRRYTQVGHGHQERGHDHGVVIDRRGGSGWAGALAGGILGAAAGLALGGAVAPAPMMMPPPPMVGTVVPALPGECVTVPSYNGGALYDCGNIYYEPIYEGTSLMFQIVPRP